MNQIALPLAWPEPADERDFLTSPANAAAVRHLTHRALWPVMACLLTGPRKSGRSLLGRVFAGTTGGTLIDDADRQDEERIFHAWNRAQAERRPLLLIADAPPPEWAVTLPDLASRLAATPRVAIRQPDDALARALLEKLLGRRGHAPTPELLAQVLARAERTYLGLQRAIDMLDEAALARRVRLTAGLARRVFGGDALAGEGPASGDV